MNQLPKTVTTTMYIHANDYGDASLFSVDMSEYGYTVIGEVEVTVDVPQDVDIIAAQIASVEKAKSAVVPEYETKLAQIDEKLQNLRSLTYDGATA